MGSPIFGKSTLFNALLKKQQALAANYPFATIEPNVGIVPVPDDRLLKLAEVTKEEEKMSALPPLKPATVEFVDIAGLVKGAADGAGLGNKFLSHIREVSVIAHVVRAFDDADVIREGSVSPMDDYETIQTELILADMQSLLKAGDNRKIDPVKKEAIRRLREAMDTGIRAFDVELSIEEKASVDDLFLLTNKPEIIVLNVSEKDYSEVGIQTVSEEYSKLLNIPADKCVVICAKVESELASLSDEEQKEYLSDLGLAKSGLERLIQKAYSQLGLISFLTAGEKEVRAWTTRREASAPEAAGEIHTDFIKKFIKAEVVSYDDYVSLGGRKKARGSRESQARRQRLRSK